MEKQDLTPHTDEHINLVCMNCGKIDDIDEDALREIQIKAAKKSKYLILKSSFRTIRLL